jgi:hypothetical protein
MIHYINNTNIDALAQCFTVAITRVCLSQFWDFTVQLRTAFASLYNLLPMDTTSFLCTEDAGMPRSVELAVDREFF